MAHSVRAGCIWAGTTSRCIVGGSRRCFALSRFICARHLRSEIRSQRSDISQIAPAAEMLLRPGVTLQRAFEPCAASQGNLTSYVANLSSARQLYAWRVPSRIVDRTMKVTSSRGLLAWDSGDYQSSTSLGVISRCQTEKKLCG